MKRSLVVLAALIAPSIAFSQDGPRPISLQEAVGLARKNAPTMIQARGQIRTSNSSLRVAKWAYFPLNGLQFGYGSSTSGGATLDAEGFLRQRPASDWSFSQNYGSASLTLWDGGTKLGNIKTARANVEAAEIGEISSSFTIAQQVKAQYYSIIQARENEANARKTLEQAQFLMGLARARVAAGTANVIDTLNTLTTISSAQLNILTFQNNQANANAQLTRLTASDFPVTAIVSDTSDPPRLEISDTDLMSMAEQGPAVRTSAANLRVAELGEKNSKAVYWPQITASAGFSRSNQDDHYDFGAGKMGYGWNFGLNASFKIFDGFARENSILSAKIRTDNAEASLREAKLTARQNMTQQLNALHTAEEQIRINRFTLTVGEEQLRIANARYQAGVGLYQDVLNAQNNLNTTRASLTNARVSARNARAQIESLIGRDLQQ